MLARVLRGVVLPLLLSGVPAALDCAGQASPAPRGLSPGFHEPNSKIRRSELVLAEKVVRQALRYVPRRLRIEDCQVVADLDTVLEGQDPGLIRQARGYEAFVLGNHYPIFVNLNAPLLRSAVLAYKQDPMANSVFIYLLAAVLAHERVHAGGPDRSTARLKPGDSDERKAYQAELLLLYQFRDLRYIGGDDVDRYIDHVEELARTFRKQD